MATLFGNWATRCLSGFFYNAIILLFIISDLGISSVPFNTDESHSQVKEEESSEFSYAFIIISISSLCIFVILLTLCGFENCLFWKKRQNTVPGFSNPIVEHGMGPIMSPIDASALELDPVVFEPLPNISELSPHSFLSPTIPLSLNDSTIFAHDWFEEPHKNFPRGQIEYAKEIGKGWFGQVIESEAFDIVPFTKKMKVNVKVLREDANSVEQMRFLDEARVFRDSNHGNVMKLLGHSIETMPFILILEHFPLGDLKTYLISSVSRAEMFNAQRIIPRMALDVARGLDWIISNGFFHGDLSCRNCQVGSEGRIVLGDYGLSTQTYRDDYFWSYNIAIPIRWAAPETLHCTPTTIQTLKVTGMANVWSYGVVLWELCSFGKLPYSDMIDDDVINRVICEKDYTLSRPLLPLSDTESLYSIMQMCFSISPSNRPQMGKIVEQLEDLISEDLFEKKWEQFGKGSNQKKSVSFSGIEDLYNQDYVKDDEEEDLWRQNVEKSTVTQKVIEKSQSVQDLMILTHVEESDLNEMESLSFVLNTGNEMTFEEKLGEVKSSLAASLNDFSSSQEMFEPTPPDDSNTKSKQFPKSLKEKMPNLEFTTEKPLPNPEVKIIEVESAPRIQVNTFEHTPNLDVVKINVIEPTPEGKNLQVTPNPETQINVIEPSPVPGVKINLIEPTPSPGVRTEDAAVINATQVVGSKEVSKPKKLKFLFDDDILEKGRKASTPIKSPDPNAYKDLPEEDVFENSSQTCSISPISSSGKESTSSESNKTPEMKTNGNNVGTSISMGADDSFGLKPYQKVSSTIDVSSRKNSDEPQSEIGFNRTFIEDSPPNSDEKKETASSWAILTRGDEINEYTSWDNITGPNSRKEQNEETSSVKIIDETRETEAESEFKTPNEIFSSPANTENYMSAGSFEEAIVAATEEHGSLVFTDLEGPNSPQVVPEKRGSMDSPLKDLKVPFVRDDPEAFGDNYHPDFEAESDDEVRTLNQVAETLEFVPSKWDVSLVPSKSAIKSPDLTSSSGDSKTSLRKSVSFERKKQEYVYEYEPEPKEIPIQNAPMQATLDWDLSSEELEAAIIHEDDSEDEVLKSEKNLMGNPIDLYRLSAGFMEEEGFYCQNTSGNMEAVDEEVGGRNNSRLGELRHTRENLRLDLSRGEASFLEESNEKKLDSGVGSSTNVSPFNPPKPLHDICDKESE